jgi:hypothetical protein
MLVGNDRPVVAQPEALHLLRQHSGCELKVTHSRGVLYGQNLASLVPGRIGLTLLAGTHVLLEE